MGVQPDARLKCPSAGLFRVKSGRRIKTARMWPRKLESSKECVTTHLPNPTALKMDGAQARHLYLAFDVNAKHQRVGERVGTTEAYSVKRSEGAYSADLGCSSDYSSATLEGRSGKRFRDKGTPSRVSRS